MPYSNACAWWISLSQSFRIDSFDAPAVGDIALRNDCSPQGGINHPDQDWHFGLENKFWQRNRLSDKWNTLWCLLWLLADSMEYLQEEHPLMYVRRLVPAALSTFYRFLTWNFIRFLSPHLGSLDGVLIHPFLPSVYRLSPSSILSCWKYWRAPLHPSHLPHWEVRIVGLRSPSHSLVNSVNYIFTKLLAVWTRRSVHTMICHFGSLLVLKGPLSSAVEERSSEAMLSPTFLKLRGPFEWQ